MTEILKEGLNQSDNVVVTANTMVVIQDRDSEVIKCRGRRAFRLDSLHHLGLEQADLFRLAQEMADELTSSPQEIGGERPVSRLEDLNTFFVKSPELRKALTVEMIRLGFFIRESKVTPGMKEEQNNTLLYLAHTVLGDTEVSEVLGRYDKAKETKVKKIALVTVKAVFTALLPLLIIYEGVNYPLPDELYTESLRILFITITTSLSGILTGKYGKPAWSSLKDSWKEKRKYHKEKIPEAITQYVDFLYDIAQMQRYRDCFKDLRLTPQQHKDVQRFDQLMKLLLAIAVEIGTVINAGLHQKRTDIRFELPQKRDIGTEVFGPLAGTRGDTHEDVLKTLRGFVKAEKPTQDLHKSAFTTFDANGHAVVPAVPESSLGKKEVNRDGDGV